MVTTVRVISAFGHACLLAPSDCWQFFWSSCQWTRMTTEKCHVLTSRNFLKAAQVFFPAWCDTSSGEFSLKNTKLGGGCDARSPIEFPAWFRWIFSNGQPSYPTLVGRGGETKPHSVIQWEILNCICPPVNSGCFSEPFRFVSIAQRSEFHSVHSEQRISSRPQRSVHSQAEPRCLFFCRCSYLRILLLGVAVMPTTQTAF